MVSGLIDEWSGALLCLVSVLCEHVGSIVASAVKVHHFLWKFAWLSRLQKTLPRSSLCDRWVPELASLGEGS